MKYTVVIPTLNPPASLVKRIRKLKRKCGPEVEWVVVNDGSNPNFADVWKHLEALGCLVLHHERNRGLPAARNTGFRVASGEFVLPVDDDDLFSPDFLWRAAALMLSPENAHVGFVYSWVNLKGSEKGILVTEEWLPERMLVKNLCCSCSVIRKSAWLSVGGYDETFLRGLEDWDLWLLMLEKGFSGSLLPEPMVTYVRSSSSMLADLHTNGEYWLVRERLVAKHRDLYKLYGVDIDLSLERKAWQPPRGTAWQVMRLLRTLPLRSSVGRRLLRCRAR